MSLNDDLATLREGLRVFGREVGMHDALDRVEAEIARLQRHPDAWSQQAFDQQKARADVAEAEVARLRDGLERIGWHELTWKEARDAARALLAEGPS